MDEKDVYIQKISDMCETPYGSLLLELMQIYEKRCLSEITLEEAKEFFEKLSH